MIAAPPLYAADRPYSPLTAAEEWALKPKDSFRDSSVRRRRPYCACYWAARYRPQHLPCSGRCCHALRHASPTTGRAMG